MDEAATGFPCWVLWPNTTTATTAAPATPGKQADLVLIKGDSSKNIADIENVETVFKSGVGFDSAKLIQSVSGQVGIR